MSRIESYNKEGKKFTNTRFFERDFSNQDLANADFRSAKLYKCNFTGADLSYANFEGANCYESDFTDSVMYKTNFRDAVLAKAIFKPKKCFGITLTLHCDTFDKATVDRTLMLYWLYMPTMMNIEDKDLETKLVALIGHDTYKAITRVFKDQVL